MAYVTGAAETFFSQETYQAYVERKIPLVNERLRGEDETFFDAMLSEDADLTKWPTNRMNFPGFGNPAPGQQRGLGKNGCHCR